MSSLFFDLHYSLVKQPTTSLVDGITTGLKVEVLIEQNNSVSSIQYGGVSTSPPPPGVFLGMGL